MTDAGYHRSFLPLGLLESLDATIEQDTLDLLLGNQFRVSVGDVVFVEGTVTDVRAQTGRLMVVVESGGRSCAICGHIYPEDDAHLLVSASSFPDKVRALRPGSLAKMTPWAPVCVDWSACERRVLADEPPNGGEPTEPARFVYDRRGQCRHCDQPIYYDGVWWRHDATELIPCADNIKNAGPIE